MGLPLAGLAVAVTRPARQNDALLQAFQGAGATATAIPLLSIDPLSAPADRARIAGQLMQLAQCDFGIVISQNAAVQALQALATQGLSWPASVPAYAVGSATAQLLRQHGIPCTSPERMDSEGLLALPALQGVARQRALIFRGCGGRETLAQVLRERGASVDYCELYHRRLPDSAAAAWAAWLHTLGEQPALVCINSRDTLDHLQVVDPGAASRHNLTLLVPGERVARAAAQAGFPQVLVAPDATDASTLDTAIRWYSP